MATEKQIEYIKKLSNWKKQPLPGELEKLSETEASQLIDTLKALKSKNGSVEPQPQTIKKKGSAVVIDFRNHKVNGIRVGLAMKHVDNYKTDEWVNDNPDEYAALVLGSYIAKQAAQQLINKTFPEVTQ